MTSGGATSNLTALKAARDSRATGDIRRDGITERLGDLHLRGGARHDRGGRGHARPGVAGGAAVPTDERQQMRVDLLEQAIEADIADGVRPIAVAATAGTTATGSIDPLDQVAQ